jgi:hypothetical protein
MLTSGFLGCVALVGTSALRRATRRNSPEDGIPQIHCRENLKSYIFNLNIFSFIGLE